MKMLQFWKYTLQYLSMEAELEEDIYCIGRIKWRVANEVKELSGALL